MSAVIDTVEEFWTWLDVEVAAQYADKHSVSQFQASLMGYLGVQEESAVVLAPSGGFGLERLLRQHLRSRRSVLAPAFNCRVVQDSIEAAGGTLHLYDFVPTPGLFDWDALLRQVDSTTGAIIVTHYFGVPVDFRPILDFCRRNEILVIEDCAHTLGGRIGDAFAGTLADAAIFSFNYDKPISLGWGGAVLVNNPSYRLAVPLKGITVPGVAQEMSLLREFWRAMGERRAAIPRQHRVLERVFRRLRLRRTHPFRKAPAIGIGAVQAELGLQCLARYDKIRDTRIERAEVLASQCPGRTWPVAEEVTPAWLKQKVRFPDPNSLRRSARRLQRQGLRASNFNWPTLLRGDHVTLCSNATEAAELWMDVPIHQNLGDRDFDLCIRELNCLDLN